MSVVGVDNSLVMARDIFAVSDAVNFPFIASRLDSRLRVRFVENGTFVKIHRKRPQVVTNKNKLIAEDKLESPALLFEQEGSAYRVLGGVWPVSQSG